MAKNTQPIAKRCKALGISPAVMGYNKKTTTRNANPTTRRKKSEYATQLQEKQKVKFIYGVLEKQFLGYYEKAVRMPGKAGDNLLIQLESRLDNVVFRLGYAATRREARQLVNHGHFLVNGKKVNIPSYQVKPGMVIELREASRKIERFRQNVEANSFPSGSSLTRTTWSARSSQPRQERTLNSRSKSISSSSCTPSNSYTLVHSAKKTARPCTAAGK